MPYKNGQFLMESYTKVTLNSCLAGGSLGVEYGLFTSHAHYFLWLYISLLVTGMLLFLFLSRIRVTGQRGSKSLKYGTGIIMILGGLVMLLLS